MLHTLTPSLLHGFAPGPAVLNPAVLKGFNPQPDPPGRLLIGATGLPR